MAFTQKRIVQFAETDMAGVMHFANYFRIMEETEHAFWRSLGESVHTETDGETISWPRVSVNCSFVSPVRFEDELMIELSIVTIGKSSLTMRYDFSCDGREVAQGEMKTVFCAIVDGKFEAVAIPESIGQLLSKCI